MPKRPSLAALREEWKSRNVTPPPMTLVSLPAAVQLAAGALHPGQKRYASLTWGSVFDLGFTAPGQHRGPARRARPRP